MSILGVGKLGRSARDGSFAFLLRIPPPLLGVALLLPFDNHASRAEGNASPLDDPLR